jgi:hypothetical protein
MELNLVAQLLLIGLQDDGSPHPAAGALDYGMAGAVLIELTTRGRVSTTGETVTVLDRTPTGDPVLDHGLGALPAEMRSQEAINLLREGLRDATLDQLVAAGVLRRERHKILWVIPDERFPGAAGVRAELQQRLAAALDGDGALDARTGSLLSLVRATGLAEAAFPDRSKAEVQPRIEARTSAAGWSDGGTRAAVAEVEAALLAVLTVVFLGS